MSSFSSDSESDNDEDRPSRLGECEVCGAKQAIYTCPKCEVKTCCLDCVRIHKKELECSGIRDRTKFIRINDFTDTDLLSDYRLLEECARFVCAVKRDEKKKYSRIDKDLPIHLYKLKIAAVQRGTILQFLAQNFTRHKVNTTRYNYKTNIISWRVEWVFPNVESKPLKFIDEKCLESKKLSDLIAKYLDPSVTTFEGSKDLVYYKSVGFKGVKVLLKAEKVKGSSRKFFELDTSDSLAENLSGKCIVEFPIIFVILKDHAYNFEIITPEDEFDYENKSSDFTQKEVNEGDCETTKSNGNVTTSNSDMSHIKHENGHQKKRQKTLLTEKIAKEKKKVIEMEIKALKKKQPKNLLFTTGYSSEESISSSEDEDENK